MSSAIVALILAALMITSGMAFSKTAISSVDTITQDWKQAVQSNERLARTEIRIVKTESNSSWLDVYLQNTGEVPLSDFAKWDVIVQYYGQGGAYFIRQLAYGAAPPVDNEWTVEAIYVSTNLTGPEVFEPGILDPDETGKLRLKLAPLPEAGAPVWVIIATDNGITASAQFQG